MKEELPQIVVLGGPNGAGKTTAAQSLLRGALHVAHFVNADIVARGLSGFDPDSAAVLAARVMLERMEKLASSKESFAFESTLAGRTLAPWLSRRIAEGYSVQLVYLSLMSAETAIARVTQRVRRGGHNIPEATIRRRFSRSIRNFFELYRPLASIWRMYDNESERPYLVARGEREAVTDVRDESKWSEIKRHAGLG